MYFTKNGAQSSLNTAASKPASTGNTAADQARQRAISPQTSTSSTRSTPASTPRHATDSQPQTINLTSVVTTQQSSGNTAADEAKKRSTAKYKTAIKNTNKVARIKKITQKNTNAKLEEKTNQRNSEIKEKVEKAKAKLKNTTAQLAEQKGKQKLRDKKVTHTGNTIADIEAKKGIAARDKKNAPSTLGLELQKNGLSLQKVKEIAAIPAGAIMYVKSVKRNEDGELEVDLKSISGKTSTIIFETKTQKTAVVENGSVVYKDKTTQKLVRTVLPRGYEVYYDFNEDDKKDWREFIGLDDNDEIIGYSLIEVNGHSFPIVYTGNTSFVQMNATAYCVDHGLQKFPEEALEKLENSDFGGYVVGDSTNVLGRNALGLDGSGVAGLASGNRFVYLNSSCMSMNNEGVRSMGTACHETGHIIDFENGEEEYGFHLTENDEEFATIYEDNKKTFQQAFDDDLGYNSKSYPDGIPNKLELYAEAVKIYCTKKEELETLFPELYEYVDKTLKQ